MSKIKVLFIVSEFYQAGTQRFTYEIDRAINKKLFDVEILSLLPLNKNVHFKDHYFPLHQELGTKINFLSDVNVLLKPTLFQRIRRKLFSTSLPNESQPMLDFFDQFNCISVMGEYNFKEIERYLKVENRKKIFIHIQNSRFQKLDLYSSFVKEEKYHFVSGFDNIQIKWELAEFIEYQHTCYNLSLKIENNFRKSAYKKSENPKIGIFTRLTYTKPLTPFLETFKIVQSKIPGAELHLFGTGDPEKEGVLECVQNLNLMSHVFFRGHQENLVKTAVEEDLDLVWLHGYHGLPGGWAGFDITTAKIPQLFWNFGAAPNTLYHPFFPMFEDFEDFGQQSIFFLNNPSEAQKLVNSQYEYINENYNIHNNIAIIERLFEAQAKSSSL
jgi:glycosyltransferase involved in cell wall biosynthesis